MWTCFRRGNRASAVEPGLPAVLAESDEDAVLRPGKVRTATSWRRLELARRLTAPGSRAAALVARVRVNPSEFLYLE